jgi:hypothetical protein
MESEGLLLCSQELAIASWAITYQSTRRYDPEDSHHLYEQLITKYSPSFC